MENKESQMDLSEIEKDFLPEDKKGCNISEERKQPVIEEKIDCQYCQDGGPCMYCERGKIEAQKIKKVSNS